MFLLMGSHLFDPKYLRALKKEHFVMIEDYGLCTHFKYHKQKLVFFLESMRNHAELLKKRGFKISYVCLDKKSAKKSFTASLKEILKKHRSETLKCFSIEDRFFKDQLSKFCSTEKINLVELTSPLFINSEQEITELLAHKKHPLMRAFYENQRKNRGILVKAGKPTGGKYSFDADNRLSLPRNILVPNIPSIKHSKNHADICLLVNKLFKTHPGSTNNFFLPTTRSGALRWLKNFFEKRLENFGAYEDALSQEYPFVFHSVISPLLNTGLLTPNEVLEKALKYGQENNIPINSLEGFVRQILGWREFIRGVDLCFGEKQHSNNFFSHKRKLTNSWYEGDTGIVPLDDCIKKAQKYAYCHHIERLMVISNIMLLSEIDPKSAYQWFMEMFVDSADWVMGPNVFGMGLFSDGGIFASKPYICGSNYIIKMSDYKKGDWCEVLDGLYWRFISKHKTFFKKQPRLNMAIVNLDRMELKRKKRIFLAAESFIEHATKA